MTDIEWVSDKAIEDKASSVETKDVRLSKTKVYRKPSSIREMNTELKRNNMQRKAGDTDKYKQFHPLLSRLNPVAARTLLKES